MKPGPSFLQGVAVAFVLSLVGAVLFTALSTLFAGGFIVRLIIALLGFAYVLYLLRGSRERAGRVATVALWCVGAGAAWFTGIPLALYLVVHVGMVWLIRSLYFYSSALPALADMGLSGLALAAAAWAAHHTGSVFLTLWTFFLVQALFVAIPRSMRGQSGERPARTAPEPFERAHRAAQSALRRLSVNG